MNIKLIGITFILLLPVTSIFAQEKNLSDLVDRVNELEKRIEVLEKIILNKGYSSALDFSALELIDTTLEIKNNKASDKSNWRKLRIGMKESDVIELLGEPEHITKHGKNSSSWRYANMGFLSFEQDGLESWNEP